MQYKLSTLVFLLMIPFSGLAWQNGENLVIGTTHSISSEIYGKQRELMVTLPDVTKDSGQDYPVLYVLDAQNWFLEVLGQYKILASTGYVPPMIIVGINTDDSPRFGFFAQAEKLQDHLEEEIIPYIEANFQASAERLVMGWQFASAFLIQTLAEKPQLFDGWLTASPYPIQGQRMDKVRSSLESGSLDQETLVFATNLNESSVEEGAVELKALLEEKAPESLRWKYVVLQQELKAGAGHRFTPIGTLYSGLRTYYEHYPVLEINDLAEYKVLGGHAYVTAYYKTRSELYGFPTDIPQEGMFFLMRMSLDSDDLQVFDFYMQQFKNTDFFQNVNAGWGTSYADFYLRHKKPQQALELFRIIAEAHPDSTRPVHGIARSYLALNNKQQALKHYEKAIEMAERNNDRRLETYKSELEKLKSDK